MGGGGGGGRHRRERDSPELLPDTQQRAVAGVREHAGKQQRTDVADSSRCWSSRRDHFCPGYHDNDGKLGEKKKCNEEEEQKGGG